MPELRKDPVSDVWVILAPERKRRPQFYKATGEYTLTPENCPFCEGNEEMTPPEITALRDENSKANSTGWRQRIIPNKYPALRVEGQVNREADGFYDKMNGIGAHEVIIETTSHTKGIDRMELETVTEIFLAYKHRIQDLKKDFRFRHIQVFKNHGMQAGATISHPHSQIVALPVIPARLKDRLAHAEAHYKTRERCIFCDIIRHEEEFRKRVLLENNDYIVIAPYAPRLPFELAIYPKAHHASYEDMNGESLRLLATIYRETIGKINKALESPAYNMILQDAPFAPGNPYTGYFHWSIELTPCIGGTGGFEIGTQSYINSIPPEESIRILK